MSADADSREDDLTGATVGRYRIERRLGAGGMGAVWAGVQEPLGRRIAIKVLRREYSESADIAARFKREAEVAASLSHPNIAAVTDFGVEHGRAFIVMDLLEGEALASLLAREGRLTEDRVNRICTQLLAALTVAHDRGVVHRDLKPENIFIQRVSDLDLVKLLDFGIARVEAGEHGITRTGTVLGTPAYMSPEQARGKSVDARSDLFSLGAVMYEMLAGRRPFAGSSFNELMFAVVEEQPTPLDKLERPVSPSLASVVARAMEKDPPARFASAREMSAALDALGEPPTAPRSRGTLALSPTLASEPQVTPRIEPRQANERSWSRVVAIVGVIAAIAGSAALCMNTLGTPASPRPSVAPEPAAGPPPPPTPASSSPPASVTATIALAPASTTIAPPSIVAVPPPASAGAPPEEPSRTATPPAPTLVTVQCGSSDYPQDLFVIRPRDRIYFGSIEGLGDMPRGITTEVREAFTAQAAAGIARCFRGRPMQRGQSFDIDIGPDGHVTRVEVSTYCPVASSVAACAQRALSGVVYANASGTSFRVRLGADIVGR